jgi:hypothetical protein
MLKFCRARAALFLLCSAALFGQSDRGNLTGTISDPANAVVPTATVVATNSETGVQSRTVATSTGNYTISALPAGTYDLSVEAAGFKKYLQRGISVQVAQTARVDVTLEVGSTSETVSVSADASLLKTEDAAQSDTLSGDRINALPLNFAIGAGAIRNPLSFVALAPGSSINGWNDIKVNGAPNNTFRIIFEGQDTTSDLNPRVSDESQPSVESIQEFTLQTSNFAPEFGQVTGGLFNFTSRSGTNQFHGSAYDYFTNEDLNAGIPFTDSGNGHLVRPRSRKSDFGGSIGGPVWIPKVYDGHDRTFFFFNYEMYRSHQGNDIFGTVPTDAMRNGDFGSILTGRVLGTDPLGRSIMENAIYDPATSRVVNGLTVRDPYQNNVIPMNRLDPVALKMQALLPHATRSGNLNNFEERFTLGKIQAIPTIKIDHNFTSNSHLAVYYSQQRTDKDNSQDGFPDPLSARRFQTIRSHTTRINYDHSLTPTTLLHVGAGYQRYNNPDTAPPGTIAYDPLSQLGIGGLIAGTGFPGIKFGNSTSFGTTNTNAFGGINQNNGGGASLGPINRNSYLMDKPTAVATLTHVRGNHTYKAGGEWRLDTFSNINTIGVSGIYNFSAIESGLPSTQGQNLQGGLVGFPYASFLTGAVNSASISNAQLPQYRKQAWGFFAQDTWKATRKLTVTYGLRYDYQPAPHELHYRTSEFSPAVPNPSAGGLLGGTFYAGDGPGRCNCTLASTYPYALGPRLGVAYQLDDKTVIRGGWAITYGQAPNFNYIGGGSSLGMGFNTINFSNPTYGVPALQFANGLNFNPGALYAATYDPGIRPSPGQINTPPSLIDHNGGRPSRMNQWNISIQRELTTDLVVEAAYVGNRGAWEQANGLVSLNGLSPARLAQLGLDASNASTRALLTSPLSSPQAQAAGFRAPYAGYSLGNTVAQSLRPFPQFGNLGITWAPLGDSWYDALQLKVTNRLSHGLDLTANYTRSKNLTTAEDQDGTTVATANVFNRAANKTFSRNDQPNIFVLAFNYQTPTWGRNTWTRRIVSGWTVGGILRYASGTPIQAPIANNNLNSVYFTGTFANRVPGQPLFLKDLNCGCIDPNKDFVLNPKAWVDPGPGQFTASNAYYNDYRFARRPDEELSFGRVFHIRESMSFQIRAEFFNVFNRTYLVNPDSGNAGATQALNRDGSVSSGFGRISTGSLYNSPRSGQIVARFQF